MDEFKCFLVSDKPRFFIALAELDDFVDTLRESVWNRLKERERDVSLMALRLYKIDIPFQSEDDLVRPAGEYLAQNPEPLRMSEEISTLFPGGPHKDRRIDILVSIVEEREDGILVTGLAPTVQVTRPGSPLLSTQERLKQTELAIEAPIDSDILPRKDAVAALFDRAKWYGFVMVHGTPASGKSTTAQLLARHVQQTGRYHVIKLDCWPPPGRTDSYLSTIGWPESPDGRPSFLILDEAQSSYDDDYLWNFYIQSLSRASSSLAVFFSNYSYTYNPHPESIIPFSIPLTCRVSLQPRTSGENDHIPAVGLLFSSEETTEYLETLRRKTQTAVHYDYTMIETIHALTCGHPGAISGLHAALIVSSLYRALELKPNPVCTSDTLMGAMAAPGVLDMLKRTTLFGRGLPGDADLANLPNANFLRGLLRNKAMRLDTLTPKDQAIADDTKIYDFVLNILKNFSVLNLDRGRDDFPGISRAPRPPEAQFQDEFYRCCSVYTGGQVKTYSEYGNKQGRIDFFIPSRKWGIELLRDGDKVEDHYTRFTTGEYSKWLHQEDMTDFIIIDCRFENPKHIRLKNKYPDIPCLHHAVFRPANAGGDMTSPSARILNNNLELLEEFALLSS